MFPISVQTAKSYIHLSNICSNGSFGACTSKEQESSYLYAIWTGYIRKEERSLWWVATLNQCIKREETTLPSQLQSRSYECVGKFWFSFFLIQP